MQTGGVRETTFLGCISEAMEYKMFILGRDIGWGLLVCNVMV